MSWTKRQLITEAYTEIGMANYVFDLEPEQLESACRRMDSMVSSWAAIGVNIAYPLSSGPDATDIDGSVAAPDYCNLAIYLNLALLIAPTVGKMVSADTRKNARDAYLNLLKVNLALPAEMQLPTTMPQGAGTKSWMTNGPFVPPAAETED